MFGEKAEVPVLRLLAQGGYKLTCARRAVVRAVVGRTRPFTVAEVHQWLRERGLPGGLTSVYRTLEVLAKLGAVERFHQDEGCHSYILASSHHRHHLVCSGCGLIYHFPECNVEELIPRLTQASRFAIQGHRLELYGLCEACQRVAS